MFHVPNQYRLRQGPHGSNESYGNNGAFSIPAPKSKLCLHIIASDGMNWEHVSVSLPNRAPNWTEMCFVKSLFWDEEDTVIQYHPPKSVYVNVHSYCLHLWRPFDFNVPTPPMELIG